MFLKSDTTTPPDTARCVEAKDLSEVWEELPPNVPVLVKNKRTALYLGEKEEGDKELDAQYMQLDDEIVWP